MDCTVHGILQVRILECVAYPFSSGSSQPRNRTRVSCSAGGFFINWAIRQAPDIYAEKIKYKHIQGFPCGSAFKESPAMRETWVRSLGWEDPLEKGKATHSSILARRIPWTTWGHTELDTTKQLSLSQQAADKTYFKRQSKRLFSCYNIYLVCSLV